MIKHLDVTFQGETKKSEKREQCSQGKFINSRQKRKLTIESRPTCREFIYLSFNICLVSITVWFQDTFSNSRQQL